MNDFSDWLFIDLADLSEAAEGMTVEDWKRAFPGCRVKGARQPLRDGDWRKLRGVSVAFTRVGATILDRCPNLQWVMVRGHASNCVDIVECRRRGIGVVSAGAFTNNCRDYIVSHLGPQPYVFYGWGRIPRAVHALVIPCQYTPISSISTQSHVVYALEYAGTVVATVPPPRDNRPPLFSRNLFSRCSSVKFISICHEPLMENEALTWAIREGHVAEAVVDTLREKGKDELLATGKVLWTKDSAWKVNFRQAEYQDIIKRTITWLRDGSLTEGVIVPRR